MKIVLCPLLDLGVLGKKRFAKYNSFI